MKRFDNNWYVGDGDKVTLIVHEATKYEATEDDRIEVKYDGVEGFEVVTGERAEAIEAESDCEDEFHEYLVIYFENGETSTFRNSHTDLFVC